MTVPLNFELNPDSEKSTGRVSDGAVLDLGCNASECTVNYSVLRAKHSIACLVSESVLLKGLVLDTVIVEEICLPYLCESL